MEVMGKICCAYSGAYEAKTHGGITMQEVAPFPTFGMKAKSMNCFYTLALLLQGNFMLCL
jgi:hypothetical protein